jgi:hypothetical protein
VSEITLNDRQYEFMQKYHETIEVGVVMGELLHEKIIIKALKEVQEYHDIFGEMMWDDIRDRYESHPNYDPSFRRKLQKQFISLKFHE